MLPTLGYCKLCCCELWGAWIVLNWCCRILRVLSSMELPGQKAVSFLEFWGNSIPFSIVAAPACIPHNSVLGNHFLHNLTSPSCLLIWLWWPFLLVLSGISFWFKFASLWWLVRLSILSYVSGPSMSSWVKCLFRSFGQRRDTPSPCLHSFSMYISTSSPSLHSFSMYMHVPRMSS